MTDNTSTQDSNYINLRIPVPNVMSVHALIIIGLIVLSVAIYLPGLQGEFLYSWDDQRYVTDNYRITSLSSEGLETIFTEPYFGTYIPITTLSWAVDYQLWELDPYGYHLTNLMIHTANGVLVYIFLFVLLRGAGAQTPIVFVAGIGAFLFLVHPVQVEIVVWVSQRKALLGLFFTLLAFLAHIRSSREDASYIWLIAGYALFGLAVLSKAVSVGAPICFIIYDFFWARKSVKQIIARNIIPLMIGIAGGLSGALTQGEAGAIRNFFGGTLITHMQVIFVAIWDYIPNLVLPMNMNALYIYPPDDTYIRIPETILGLTVFFGSLGIGVWDAWRWRTTKKPPLILMTVMWVWAFYAPVSNIVPMPMLRADRYMYVPVILIFALVGLGIIKAFHWMSKNEPRWTIPTVFVLVILAGIMLTSTIQHRDVWHSSETLWQDHLRDYPDSSSGLLNLGVYYFKTAQYDKAQPLFERILASNPDHSKANEFMGNLAFNAGDYETSANYYQRAIEVNNPPYSYYGLGRSLEKLDNYSGAYDAYTQAVTRNPRFAEAYPYLGEVAIRVGQRDVAVEALQTAVQLGSADADSYSFLCILFGERELYDEATTNCIQALTLAPENGRYAGRYAHVLNQMGNHTQAIEVAQTATELAPDESLGFRTLGDAYRLLGDADNARLAYQQALSIFPDNALALEGLAKIDQ